MPALSFAVLRRRGFRLLLATRLLNSMTWQAHAVIGGWQIYSLTHNLFLLGLTGLAEAIPAITCALFAGHIVDISKPQRVYMACLLLNAINILAIFLIAGNFVPAPGGSAIPWIFLSFFISGISRSFFMPSSFALLPQIVTKPDLPAASAWMNSGFQIATIAAPALAGLVYGGYGVRGAWLITAATVSIATFLSFFIKPNHALEAAKREPAIHAIKAGWVFILKNQVMLSMMALDMLAVMFGGAVAMLPAYADQVLHTGPQGLGLLRAAPALGAVLTSLLFAVRPMRTIAATRMLWVVAGFGVCMIGFGLSSVFWLSILFLALSGMFDSVSMVIRGTLMQILTPDTMRGRVSSINSMFLVSSNELGAFESGTLAHLIGLVPSVALGGLATLGIVAATAILAPEFRKTVVTVDQSP